MAPYYVKKPGELPPPTPISGPPIEGEDECVAVVPFVPWRCPRCGNPKPRTCGQRDRVRFHHCQSEGCDLRYKSVELSAAQLRDPEALRAIIGPG